MTDLLTRTLPHAPSTPVEADPSAGALAGTTAHALAIAVAPSTGRFRPAVAGGSWAPVGTVLGHVTGGGGRADTLVAPVDGHVAGLLARDRQLVHRGQGLAWLQRADEVSA